MHSILAANFTEINDDEEEEYVIAKTQRTPMSISKQFTIFKCENQSVKYG